MSAKDHPSRRGVTNVTLTNPPRLCFNGGMSITRNLPTSWQPGDRVVVICHQVHTTYGGLVNASHRHHGTVQSVSIYGNVWVDLDDSTGPASKWHPDSIRPEVTA